MRRRRFDGTAVAVLGLIVAAAIAEAGCHEHEWLGFTAGEGEPCSNVIPGTWIPRGPPPGCRPGLRCSAVWYSQLGICQVVREAGAAPRAAEGLSCSGGAVDVTGVWSWGDDECEDGLWCACIGPTTFVDPTKLVNHCTCSRPAAGVWCSDTLEAPVRHRDAASCGPGLRCTKRGDSHWECIEVPDAAPSLPADASSE